MTATMRLSSTHNIIIVRLFCVQDRTDESRNTSASGVRSKLVESQKKSSTSSRSRCAEHSTRKGVCETQAGKRPNKEKRIVVSENFHSFFVAQREAAVHMQRSKLCQRFNKICFVHILLFQTSVAGMPVIKQNVHTITKGRLTVRTLTLCAWASGTGLSSCVPKPILEFHIVKPNPFESDLTDKIFKRVVPKGVTTRLV